MTAAKNAVVYGLGTEKQAEVDDYAAALNAAVKALKPKSFTVTFQPAGGKVSISSKSVTYQSAYGELPTPTRDSYTFSGWFTAGSGGSLVTKDTTVSELANHSLYAHWSSQGGGGGGGGSVVYPSRPVGSYDSVVGYAMSRIGCPYIWGAEGPDSFDCSGLVTWAYRQVGMYLPHQSEAQYAAAARVVSVSEARPGDVLWRYGHVGIAVSAGGSHYVHAPTFNAYVRDTDPLSWAQFTNALQF